MSVAAGRTNRKFVWTDITVHTQNFSVQVAVPNIQGAVKFNAQGSRGERRDQNKYLLSRNCMSKMRPCSTANRQIKVWLNLHIKQNHWGILEKKNVFLTNLEQMFKRTATHLDRHPTTTRQRRTCALKNTRLLPDGWCCLNNLGNNILSEVGRVA